MPRDHYVSQTYLKQFHTTDGPMMVYMLQKTVKPKFRLVNVKDVCNLKDGNRSDFFQNRDMLENMLKQWEPEFPHIVRRIEQNKIFQSDIPILAQLMAYFFLCNPIQRRNTEQSETVILKMVLHNVIKNKLVPPMPKGLREEDLVPEIDSEYILSQRASLIEPFCEKIRQCKWVFFKNDTEYDFCTSDYPVIVQYVKGERCSRIIFPLTPRIVIEVKILGENVTQNFQYCIEPIRSFRRVKCINTDIVKDANQFIFSHDKAKCLVTMVSKLYDFQHEIILKTDGSLLIADSVTKKINKF
jgi:hypothetical protein